MFGMLVKPFTDAGHGRNPLLFDIRPWQVFCYYRFSQSIINVELIKFALMINRDGARYKPSVSLPEKTVTSFEVVIYLLYIGQIMFPRRPDADSTQRGARKVIFPSFRINSRHITRFTTAVTTVIRSWDNFAQTCKFQSIEALTAPYINFDASVYLFETLETSEGFASVRQANSLLNNPLPTTSPTDNSSYPSSASLDSGSDLKLRAITTRFLSDLDLYLLDDQLFAASNLQSSPIKAFLHRSEKFESLSSRFDEISDLVTEIQRLSNAGHFADAFGFISRIPTFHPLTSTNFNNEHIVYVTKPPKRHRNAPSSQKRRRTTDENGLIIVDQDCGNRSTSEGAVQPNARKSKKRRVLATRLGPSEHSPNPPSSSNCSQGKSQLPKSYALQINNVGMSSGGESDRNGESDSDYSESSSESRGDDLSDSDYVDSGQARGRSGNNGNENTKKFSRCVKTTGLRSRIKGPVVRKSTHRPNNTPLERGKTNYRVPQGNKRNPHQQKKDDDSCKRKRQQEQNVGDEPDNYENEGLIRPTDVSPEPTAGEIEDYIVDEGSAEPFEGLEVSNEVHGGVEKYSSATQIEGHSGQLQECVGPFRNECGNPESDIEEGEILEGKTEDVHNDGAFTINRSGEIDTGAAQTAGATVTLSNEGASEMAVKTEPSTFAGSNGATWQSPVARNRSSERVAHDAETCSAPPIIIIDGGEGEESVKVEGEDVTCSEMRERTNFTKVETFGTSDEKFMARRQLRLIADVPCSSFPVISTLPVCIMNGLGASWGRSRDMRDLYGYPTQMWPEPLIKAIDGADEDLMRMAEVTHRSVYMDSSKMEPGRRGVFALEEFVMGDVICEFFGTLVYECEHEVGEDGREKVILRTGDLEKNLRVTEESFNKLGVALPKLNCKWEVTKNASVRRVYVVPCKTSVAATIVNTIPLGDDSEERNFVKERGTNAALTWKRGDQGIDKKAHICETAAMGIIAVRHIRADEEICAAYKSGLESATKMSYDLTTKKDL